jgi:hypothetical protein
MTSEVKAINYDEIRRNYPQIPEKIVDKVEKIGAENKFLKDQKGNEVLDRNGFKISVKPDLYKIIQKLDKLNEAKATSLKYSSKYSSNQRCNTSSVADFRFGGWWALQTTFGAYSMTAVQQSTQNATIQTKDSYIYIDVTTNPVTIFSTYYNDVYPQFLPNFFNPAPIQLPPVSGATSVNQFLVYNNDQTKLVSPWNPPLTGPVDPIQSISMGPTIHLIDDQTLHVYPFLNNNYSGIVDFPSASIFKKMKQPPSDTSLLNWNNPLNIFSFYVADQRYQNLSLNPYTKANNYIGEKAEEEFLCKIKSKKGITVSVPLRKIRITNTTNYNDALIGNDKWTSIYTGCPIKDKGIFVPITPGCTPIISGATGLLSVLNGTYPNGVGVLNNGGDATLKSRFDDIGCGGSMNDYFNCFLLNLDTTNLSSMADINGLIKLPTGIKVTVTYHISSESEYPEMMSAIRAYYYLVIRTSTHTTIRGYHPPNSARLFNTFSELRTALANGTASQNPRDNGPRYGYPLYNQYYHNWYDYGLSTGNFINVQWPLTWNNPSLEYDVAVGNYLTNVRVLYFAIQGTLESDQPDPAVSYGYLPIIPGSGRATFVSKLLTADVTTVPGLITPNGPNGDPVPAGYQTLGDWGSDFGNANAYFVGTINPILTSGKVIGYFRVTDCLFIDFPGAAMASGVYAPENPNTSTNPRIWRESLSAVYAPIFQWFNEIGCESLIIDWVDNAGGLIEIPFAISEFLGSDRIFLSNHTTPKDPCKPIISSESKELKIIEDAFNKNTKSYNCYTSLNEKYYPNSVFRGTNINPKYVTFLTDYNSISSGDQGPNLFVGNKNDGNLGCNTFCRLLGCVEGREFSFSSEILQPPYNINPAYSSENLIDPSGNPAIPFAYIRDNGANLYGWGKKQISTLRQHNGILPLPNPIKGTSKKYNNSMPFSGESLVFPDFGYNPPIRPPIPGWTNLHSYPPNQNDQSTWQFTYLDGAILTLMNPQYYFFSYEFEKLKRNDSKLSLKQKCKSK